MFRHGKIYNKNFQVKKKNNFKKCKRRRKKKGRKGKGDEEVLRVMAPVGKVRTMQQIKESSPNMLFSFEVDQIREEEEEEKKTETNLLDVAFQQSGEWVWVSGDLVGGKIAAGKQTK